MNSVYCADGVWAFPLDDLQCILSTLVEIEVTPRDGRACFPEISRGDVSSINDLLQGIRDSPISIHCQPAACSAESPITGVALPEDQYLLRISPEGRRVLILGLSAALREIEDWEFPILTSCSKEYVQGLIDVLKAAPEKE